MRDPKAEGKRWLEQAEADLSSAEYLSEGGFYYLACFQCQQATEKALKGFLYSSGETLVTGHSVEELCRWAAEKSPDFDELREKISVLDSFYIPTRYPSALPSNIPSRVYNGALAGQALELTRKALEFVREKMEER